MVFIDIGEIEEKVIFPKSEVRFVHTKNMTIGYWDLLIGAEIPEHSHAHEQVSSVIEGMLELWVDGEKRVLGPGHVAVIAPNAPHSGIARSRCRVIDVFYPVREDYI